MAEAKSTTINKLKAELADTLALVKKYGDMLSMEKNLNHSYAENNKATSKDIADLKKRLAESEMECQRMRGYIQRVQEDDVVREDLIATGDPQGEQRMVPKRISTAFFQGDQYSSPDIGMNQYIQSSEEQRRSRRHWVTYGHSW